MCTLKIEYVNTHRTCGICGATMRIRHELPAFIFYESECEGIQKSGIEVKAASDRYLAKSVLDIHEALKHIFDNDTSGFSSQFRMTVQDRCGQSNYLSPVWILKNVCLPIKVHLRQVRFDEQI